MRNTFNTTVGSLIAFCLMATTFVASAQFNVTSDTTICEGSSVNLRASGANTYNWSPSTALSGVTGDSVVANPTDTITYKVVFDQGMLTEDSLFVTINVNGLPNAGITISNDTICRGSSIELASAGDADSYQWTINGVSGILSTDDTTTHGPLSTVTYQLKTTTAGCSDSSTQEVVVNTAENFNLSVDRSQICVNQSAVFTASNNSLSYKWSSQGDLSDTVGASITATSNATTNAATFMNVNVTSEDANGCKRTKSLGVIINNLYPDTPSIAADDTVICSGNSTEFRASASGAGGNATYSWSPTNGLISPNSSATGASPSNTTTYTVTVNRGGCTRSNSVTLEVLAKPTISITQSSNGATLCQDEVDSITINSPTATSYNWGGGITSTYNVKEFLPGNTTTLNLGVVDPNGCTNFASVTINVDTSCGKPVNVLNATAEATDVFASYSSGQLDVKLIGKWNQESLSISLVDMTGSLHQGRVIDANKQGVLLDMNNLSNGLYILRVDDGNHQAYKKLYLQ